MPWLSPLLSWGEVDSGHIMIQFAFAQTADTSAGLPQFEPGFFTAQIFWEAITFLVLLYLMTKFIIPKINRLLDQRATIIQNDLDTAARSRKESEHLLAEYQRKLDKLHEEADTIMAQARKEMIERHALSMRQLEEDIQRKKQKFREEIDFAKQQATKEVRNIFAEVAILAAEKLIEKNMDTDDAKRIVEDAIREINCLKPET